MKPELTQLAQETVAQIQPQCSTRCDSATTKLKIILAALEKAMAIERHKWLQMADGQPSYDALEKENERLKQQPKAEPWTADTVAAIWDRSQQLAVFFQRVADARNASIGARARKEYHGKHIDVEYFDAPTEPQSDDTKRLDWLFEYLRKKYWDIGVPRDREQIDEAIDAAMSQEGKCD